MRIGIGFDTHKFIPNRPLFLGGVRIPNASGLEGHSDADVLVHALMDALLGAVSAGDIGEHFPDGDERFKDASSLTLLSDVHRLLKERGYEIVNLDLVAVLDNPKLSGFKRQIEECLADQLGIKPSQVSVKATTSEGVLFTGERDAAAAFAVVLVKQVTDT